MNLLLTNVTPLAVDVVAIVFVLVFALIGFANGFTKLFFKVFGTIISLLLAVLLCAGVTSFLEGQFGLVTSVSSKLAGVLNKVFGEELMNTTLAQATEKGLGDLGLGGLLLPIIQNFANDASIPLDVTLNEIIGPTFSYYLVMIVVAILLFIIFKIVFAIIAALTKHLFALPVLKQLDRLLGLAVGLLGGFIYLELAIMLLGILPIGFIQDIYALIPETTFTAFIQNASLFKLILNSISVSDITEFVKNIVKQA